MDEDDSGPDPVKRSLQTLLDSIPDFIFFKDTDSRFTQVNRACAAFIGVDDPTELLGKSDADFFPAATAREFRADERHLLTTGEAVIGKPESRVGADGHIRWVLTNKVPIRDPDGRITGLVGISREITERKLSEDALLQSTARFDSLIRNALDIITIIDVDGTITYESPAFERVFGYEPNELDGTNAFGLVHPDDLPAVYAAFLNTLDNPAVTPTVEFRFRHKDGSWRWLEAIGTNLLADPAVVGIVVNSRDVTERRGAEDRLRASESRQGELLAEASRQAQELALLGEVRTALARELELSDLFRTVVEAVARTYGYTLVSLYMREDDVLVMQHQVGYDYQIRRIPITEGVSGRVVRTGEAILIEDVRDDPDFLEAVEGIVSELCVPLRAAGQVVGFLNVESRDGVQLTDADLRLMVALSEHVNVAIRRARLYTEVRQSETHFSSLIRNALDIITILDADGTIRYESPAIERILGYQEDELVGRQTFELIHPDDLPSAYDTFLRILEAPQVSPTIEFRFRHKDGSWRWLEATRTNLLSDPAVGGIVVNSRDVTERKGTEDRLRASESRQGELHAEARRQAKELALLGEVRTALARELELSDLFRTVVEAISRTFGYTLVSLYMLDDDALMLQHQVGYDRAVERIPVTEGVSGRVVRTAEAVLIENVRSDPDFLAAHPGIVSEVCVPLHDAGQVVGALNVESGDGVRLSEADLQVMVALSEHVNVAIGRARLYTEVRRSEARSDSLIRNALEIIAFLDADGTIYYVSPAAERVLGYQPVELVGCVSFDLIHPDDQPVVDAAFQKVLDDPQLTPTVEFRFRHSDGSWRWLEATGTNLLADPAVRGIVINARDITERKQIEEERVRLARHASLRADIGGALAERQDLPAMLQRCAEAFVHHLDAAFARVWVLDDTSEVLELQASAGMYTHLDGTHSRIPMGEFKIGRIAHDLQPHLTNDVRNDSQISDHDWAIREGMVAFAGYPLQVEDRAVGVMALFARHALPQDTLEALGATADIIAHGVERKTFEARLWHHAHHDSMTNLPNRTLFMDRLRDALDKPGAPSVAVLLLDLDGFKVVNDSLGHEYGDRLLIAASQRLATHLGPGDLLARFGGDEFTILREQVTDARMAIGMAEQVMDALAAPFALSAHEVSISASVGAVLSSSELTTPTDLLRAADVALYRAKAEGKGGTALFDTTRDASALGQLDRETALRHALERGELRLHYQPKVALATGQMHGVEALVRWQHPSAGLLPPAEFIPLAEDTGMIVPLGVWVLGEACRQVMAWHEQFPDATILELSVNVSPVQVRHPGLVEQVDRVLRETGYPPERLILEITEQGLVEDTEATDRTVEELKSLGVQLAIDDFGAYQAGLGYLRRWPMDLLKLDRTLVTDIGRDERSRAIVAAVVGLGQALGMEVMGEGIETAEQLALLQELGCTWGQGHLFAPALPDGELVAFLAQGRTVFPNASHQVRSSSISDASPV